MFVIKDEANALWARIDSGLLTWVEGVCCATQFETSDEAVAAAETYGICTCWVVAV
jgi:hypothetical protein